MKKAGRTKTIKNVIVDNCVFEILATTPTKNFTINDITNELDKVYGVKPSNGYIWKLLDVVLLKNKLIEKVKKNGKRYIYRIINRDEISNLVDVNIKLPVKNYDCSKESNIVFDSVDPIKVLGQEKYNLICTKISNYGIKPVDNMILTVAAIYHYCCHNDVVSFKASDIFNKLKMISTDTILSKIHILHQKRCIISADASLVNNEIIYKLKHKPINCKTYTKDESLIEKSNVEDSPADMIANVSLTNEQIGLGVIDFIKKSEIEIDNLTSKVDMLNKENYDLLKKISTIEKSLVDEKEKAKELNNMFVSLSSKYETLVKNSKSSSLETTITLRNIGGKKRAV